MNDEKLLIKIASYYYLQELTQNQIAKKLGMSRQRVNRLLKRSRNEGIVNIRIKGEKENYIDLESSLEEKFGLLQAVVVPTPESDRLIYALGHATAVYMRDRLQDGMNVGISWGRTMFNAVNSLESGQKFTDLKVFQIVGNMQNIQRDGQPDEVTRLFADKLGCEPRLLYAPIYIKNEVARSTLIKEDSISSVLNELHKCDIAFLSVSHQNAWKDYVSDPELKEKVAGEIKSSGAVGNICLRHFDSQGRILPISLHDLLVGIDEDTLRGIPNVVCSAGGPEKYAAIMGALKGRLVSTLITDFKTANHLLNNSKKL